MDVFTKSTSQIVSSESTKAADSFFQHSTNLLQSSLSNIATSISRLFLTVITAHLVPPPKGDPPLRSIDSHNVESSGSSENSPTICIPDAVRIGSEKTINSNPIMNAIDTDLTF